MWKPLDATPWESNHDAMLEKCSAGPHEPAYHHKVVVLGHIPLVAFKPTHVTIDDVLNVHQLLRNTACVALRQTPNVTSGPHNSQ